MWGIVREGMKPYWRAERVENRLSKGMPDVVFQWGWLELKYSAKVAKRTQKLPHFTTQQRAFLNRWDNAFLLWQIDENWLLFRDHFDELGHVPYSQLLSLSSYNSIGRPCWRLISYHLRQG